MEIYRNNYRTRLVEALCETFERTARLAGEGAFRRAAIHHLIENPPTSWTLDLAGSGFAETCHTLFADDPDVGEIAWLEWAMACAFRACDASALTVEQFATSTAAFSDHHWTDLRLTLLPGTVIGGATYHLPKLWRSLENAAGSVQAERLENPQSVVVWREKEQPVFALISEAAGRCLVLASSGGSFGEICAWLSRNSDDETTVLEAGSMLRHWIELGVIQHIEHS